jgi:hypothetical protein
MDVAAKSNARTAPHAPQKRPKLAAVPAPPANHDGTFDRLVYERVRLGIMSALAVREELTFNELKSLFDVSDGNLSAHASWKRPSTCRVRNRSNNAGRGRSIG